MRLAQPARATGENHFHEARARRVAAEVAAQLVDERIVNQHRVVKVRRVEHPVGVGGHSEQRVIFLVIELIEELHRETRLRQACRTGAALTKARARGERGRIRERSLAIHRLEQRDVREPFVVRGRQIFSEGVQHQHRQGRGERLRVGEQPEIRDAGGRAGEQSVQISTGAEVRGVRDEERRGIDRRVARGQRAVARETNDGVGNRRGEFEREVGGEIAAVLGEQNFRSEARTAADVRFAGRGLVERAANDWFAAHAAEGRAAG